MPPSLLIDVLRHGEPLGGPRYRGRTDDALSKLGWQQMDDAINRGATNDKIPWSHIISSPLQRCASFAHKLAESHPLELHIEPRLSEIDFGDWDGLTSQQIMDHHPEQLLQYWENPADNTPPNGESLSAFKARIISAWNEILIQHVSTEKKHLLIVTHGGSLRLIISHILGMPDTALFNVDVPYSCLSRFQYDASNHSSQLIFHNGHLP